MEWYRKWDDLSGRSEGKSVLENLVKKMYPKFMDTKQKLEIERRENILKFWRTHGSSATLDAFKVTERTLFRWQKEIIPKSRAHQNGYQKRIVDPLINKEIIRLRTIHPRLGKEKITPLLDEYCESLNIICPSETTVGRILVDLKKRNLIPTGAQLRLSAQTGRLIEKKFTPKKKKIRRNGYLPLNPGDLLQIDGVMTFVDGKRRYTFTAVDLISRWAFSKTYTTASSLNGADFLNSLIESAPFTISHIQTDNGSEFMKYFIQAATNANLIHFHNYVKQPKYQGWVERFNRTIQEEFLNWNHQSLAYDIPEFNQKLSTWMLWYNTKRVHSGLKLKTNKGIQQRTPLQYLNSTVN